MAPNRRKQMRDLYAQVPAIQCKGLCADACGPIEMSRLERATIARRGVQITDRSEALQQLADGREFTCDALVGGRCSVYADRPMICRLWGVTETLRCPHGCEAEGVLSDPDGLALIAESLAVGNPPEDFADLPSPEDVRRWGGRAGRRVGAISQRTPTARPAAVNASLAEILRAQRSRRGWEQADLAERLGVGQQAVSAWERGISRPRRGMIVNQLAPLLGLSIEDLLRAAGFAVRDSDPRANNRRLDVTTCRRCGLPGCTVAHGQGQGGSWTRREKVTERLAAAFLDLPADAFPMVLEFFDEQNQVVHRVEIGAPGAVRIPALAPTYGPVGVRITHADGEVCEYAPHPQGEAK